MPFQKKVVAEEAVSKAVPKGEEFDPNVFINSKGHVRDRIILHESQKIPKEGQFISLNGYAFLAKPGVEIDIPRPVRTMLDTRIETETIQDDSGKSYTRNIPRITYTLVKEGVNAEEIKIPEGESMES